MKQGSRGNQDEDILGEGSSRRQRLRQWSSKETVDVKQHESVVIKRISTILRQSRSIRGKQRNYSTSSESSKDSVKGYPRTKQEHSGNSANTNLDKDLTINMDVKNLDNNLISDFDPMTKQQTVHTWLKKVEECAEIYGWNEKEIIRYSLPKLCGVARSWLHGLPTLLHSWPEWKKMLIKSFPSEENYAELLIEMLGKRAKYGESLEEYYYAKINLLNRCKIHGRRAVECLLHGVDDSAIRFSAQAAQFSEPESVLKYFKSVKIYT